MDEKAVNAAVDEADEADKEFDRLWSEASDEALDEDDPESGVALAEPAEAQAKAEPEPEAEPEARALSEPEAESGPAADDDLEVLRHKYKSALGRYDRFGEQIDDMKARLEASEQAAVPEKEDTPWLPEGWRQEDWDDFSADNPAQAEVLEKQSREVQQLKEQVVSRDRQEQEREAQARHDAGVLAVHGDYRELLANERNQLETFIESQTNPILQQAYRAVYQQGDARQVADLISDYKATRGGQQSGSASSGVEQALAVPGRAPVPQHATSRAGVPDAEDFDAAWDYFADEKID